MFPEDFTKSNVVNNTKRAFLMGNALVVGIIERIGNSISNFESEV
jgi:DNA (cytosine-5)-methyltransferase 1